MILFNRTRSLESEETPYYKTPTKYQTTPELPLESYALQQPCHSQTNKKNDS